MAAAKLQVTGINHVVLHVTEMERSKRFYMDILGFEDRNISDGPPNMKASFLQCGMQGSTCSRSPVMPTADRR